jgi:hypothetical protein
MPDINLSPYTAEQAALDRRRKLAEAMQQQAIAPIEMPNVAGAKVSPYQGLAKLLQGYIAGKNLEKTDTEQKQQQSDYLSDLGFLMRNAGKTTPATAAIPEQVETIRTPNLANQNLQEVANRQRTMRDPNAAINPFEKQIFQGMDFGQVSEKQKNLAALPAENIEERITPAVPAMPASPLLSPDLLSGNNANNYIKTSAGKVALAQYLMQQQAQQQAAAQRAQEAALAFHTVAPGGALVQGGKTIYTNPKEVLPKWEKSSIFENGQEITGWVNTNAPDIPSSFVKGATKPEMTEPQRLDAELKLFQAKVEADKAQDVGRKPTVFERLPKGVPVGAKKIGKSPDGKDVYESNGKKYVGE